MSNWISTKDSLPESGKYVLAKHSRGTWHDSDDQENVNAVVVKLVLGLSIDTREKMKQGQLLETSVEHWNLSDGYTENKRSNVYRSEDEHANNRVAFNWQQFGTDSFFGQDISHWMSIPLITNPQKKEINGNI